MIGPDDLGTSEDCQRLSVTAPADLHDGERLPVLVWIHGGGNVAGAGDLAQYDPRALGQSSGADAIAHLMISDGAERLFRRVIMQSAPLGVTTGRAAMTQAMLAAVGELSRDAPVEDILALQPVAERAARGFGMASRMPFGVQYGLPPVPDEADRDAAWREVAPRVDVLVGCAREETGVIAALVPALKGRLPTAGTCCRLNGSLPATGPRVVVHTGTA